MPHFRSQIQTESQIGLFTYPDIYIGIRSDDIVMPVSYFFEITFNTDSDKFIESITGIESGCFRSPFKARPFLTIQYQCTDTFLTALVRGIHQLRMLRQFQVLRCRLCPDSSCHTASYYYQYNFFHCYLLYRLSSREAGYRQKPVTRFCFYFLITSTKLLTA